MANKNYCHCFLFAMFALITGCSGSQKMIEPHVVSKKYSICMKFMPGTNVSGDNNGLDFEVADFVADGNMGNIYIGDFPDYPKFSSNRKYYEKYGTVHEVGYAEENMIRKKLFRFGLGESPSIYVLVSEKGAKNLALEISADTIFQCK